MAYPTKEKTWNYQLNTLCAAGATFTASYQNCMYALKASLIAPGVSAPWTVLLSSDSTQKTDPPYYAFDYWASASNLVWANTGSAHSWIVLKQAGLTTNFQLLLDLDTTTDSARRAKMYFSQSAGFTGGDWKNRPTATDEVAIIPSLNNAWHTNINSGPFQNRLHTLRADDGSSTRIVICYNGISRTFILFDKLIGTSGSWTDPVICGWNTNASAATTLTYSLFSDILSNAILKTVYTPSSSVLTSLAFTSEGFIDGAVGEKLTTANAVDSSWPMCPINVVSTATKVGRIGRLQDLWWGSTGATLADGSDYGSLQFVQFGSLILPWDSLTAPLLT